MSHRISLPTVDNEFLIEQLDGDVYDTCTGKTLAFDASFRLHLSEQAEEIGYHRFYGFSPNCVVCKDDAAISQTYPLEARRVCIMAALESGVDPYNAGELIEELAEIQRAIESGDDPRSRAQILSDLDDAETMATRRADYPM